MKTGQNITRRLRTVLACGIMTFVVSAEAKKPPQDPPPPPGPEYRIVVVPELTMHFWGSITNAGVLVGSAMHDASDGSGYQSPAVLPPRIIDGQVQYVAEDLRWLLDVDGVQWFGGCNAMNEAGIAVGVMDSGAEPGRAILWLADGTPINLNVDPAGLGSIAKDINDAGLVLVGLGNFFGSGPGGGVVVPLDLDTDGAPDTWFTDVDLDGVNDLFFPIETGNTLRLLTINEAGQVLVAEGYLLTPDFNDSDGDGNPWFADVDGDGFNDLLAALEPPEPGASVEVGGLNNLGQVVGNSDGHVVRWEFVDGVQIVTDLGSLSDRLNMTAMGISDSGRIVGTSWQDAGRRAKNGPSWLIENDTLHELLPLIVNSDGWSDLTPLTINSQGWISGHYPNWVAIPVEQP